jgi:succinate dehydrogenase/fumarate reductase flavoprotein subunit
MVDASWDRVVDVLVVGSGAGGLTAAVTAADHGCDVEVIEKAELLGGTSAWSGGMPWVPRNSHMADAGVEDSREEALTYIAGLACDREPDHELVEVFVDRAKEAFDYVEDRTALQLTVTRSYSDYFADRPGGKPMGRSLEPIPFDARAQLGEWSDRVRDTPHIPRLTQDEMAAEGARRNMPLNEQGEVPVDVVALIAEREAAGIRTLGAALVSGILRGALDLGVKFSTGTPARQLVIEDGEVVGVVAEHEGRGIRIGARRGVVLATGGFEWNRELVLAYLGIPDGFPLSPSTNVGDGLQMGLEAGAAIGNMTNAVAFPCAYDEHSTLDGRPFGNMAPPRSDPGCIIVNSQGRRFVNEGVGYMDVAKVHRTYDPQTASYPNTGPVWMVFDQEARERIICMDFVPGQPTPGWVKEAETIADLAGKMGVDPAVLREEVERWNEHVAAGADPDFGRGTVWWEGFQTGGPSPEKNMASVAKAPFYAMRLYNGILGTIGGLRIDPHARVRSARGGLIPGLYAVGNVAAGIFGQTYPGGGGTLGPNITFGYLAGSHAADQEPRPIPGSPAREPVGQR